METVERHLQMLIFNRLLPEDRIRVVFRWVGHLLVGAIIMKTDAHHQPASLSTLLLGCYTAAL